MKARVERVDAVSYLVTVLALAVERLEEATLGLGLVTHVSGRCGRADAALEGDGLPALRVDSEGRLARISLRGLALRRTMHGALHLRHRGRTAKVPVPDAGAAYDALARFFAGLRDLLQAKGGLFEVEGDGAMAPPLLAATLERAATFDAEASVREAARFSEAYPEPVEILPPDRYRDVVLKPALGCPNAGCTFCVFYQGRRFRPLPADTFSAHLDAVCALFGPLLQDRDGIFLGSASAASLADRRLLEVLDLVRARFGERARGVATFLDPDHSPPRDAASWARLKGAGLDRVVSGLETGHPELRATLGKSPDLDRFVQVVRSQKVARLPVGITVLGGVGGPDLLDAHVTRTAAVVGRMGLGASDLVYVSPVTGSLAEAALEHEARRLRAALVAQTAARVVPYAMQRFGYYP